MSKSLDRLFCFAHRGEAQCFLEELSPQKTQIENLYQTTQGLILICGEGPEKAMTSLSYALGLFPSITSVINYGICGMLRGDWTNSLQRIRCIYSFRGNEMQFLSFQVNETGKDLISSDKRINDLSGREKLAYFGDLVDREAWSLAFVCRQFGRSFECFKLPSDNAEEVVCSDIKSNALLYSQKFFEHFEKLTGQEKVELNSIPDGFYFTTAQKNIYNKLSNKLSLLWEKSPLEVLSMLPIKDILESEIHPKKRTAKLIDHMKWSIDPLGLEIKNKIQSHLPYGQNLNWNFDQTFEHDEISLNAIIRGKNDIDDLKSALDSLDIQTIQDLLRGQTHV